MKKHLPTILILVVVLAALIGLNLVFLAQPGEDEDERTGDRSSYRGTKYGTLGYYTLLKETGRPVSRLETPWTGLDDSDVDLLFVITPKPWHQPSAEEFTALERWVLVGGRLVVIDREIDLTFEGDEETPGFEVATGTPAGDALSPLVPSGYTRGVRALGGSVYAKALNISADRAVAHVGGPRGPVLVDVVHGLGRVTFVSESHFVENGGIGEVDNAALAVNLVDAAGIPSQIAFDEYHHGHGVPGSEHGVRGYLAGTPVPWMLAQVGIIALVVAVGAGTRFARAVPLSRERRTSNLEFVTSMAHIQRLADAEDLAIENIYRPFRARLCRYAGLPLKASSEAVATDAARRARVASEPLLDVMKRCEAVLAGARPGPEEITRLVGEVRRLEERLSLRR